jgi:hypothetical protein
MNTFSSEKSSIEAKSARRLIIHIIQSLSDITNENMTRTENDILIKQHHI